MKPKHLVLSKNGQPVAVLVVMCSSSCCFELSDLIETAIAEEECARTVNLRTNPSFEWLENRTEAVKFDVLVVDEDNVEFEREYTLKEAAIYHSVETEEFLAEKLKSTETETYKSSIQVDDEVEEAKRHEG